MWMVITSYWTPGRPVCGPSSINTNTRGFFFFFFLRNPSKSSECCVFIKFWCVHNKIMWSEDLHCYIITFHHCFPPNVTVAFICMNEFVLLFFFLSFFVCLWLVFALWSLWCLWMNGVVGSTNIPTLHSRDAKKKRQSRYWCYLSITFPSVSLHHMATFTPQVEICIKVPSADF